MKKLLFFVLMLAFALPLFSCEVRNTEKVIKVMTYEEYVAAELDSEVTIETFIQGRQAHWTDDKGVSKATFYTQTKEGGYFLYDMPCSADEYNNVLVEGAHIRVKGTKSAWAGEVEIINATWELVDSMKSVYPLRMLIW